MDAASFATQSSLPIGMLLNERFTLTDIINTGGFSIIYRAVDGLTGEEVALKECAPEGMVQRLEDGSIEAIDERAAGQFETALAGMEQEVTALRTLTQNGVTGIPQYLDAFRDNGTYYLAMTEVRGADLHCWAESYRMAGQPFPASLLEAVLTGVLGILDRVHASGFFHCDVKPANIIIDENGGIYLIDFGAVRTRVNQHHAVQVSPGFTPVELYPGYRASIGPWSDIYMLATLFYNIITGRVPEPANERAQTDRTPRLSSNLKLKELYSAALLNSIDKAMSVNEADRFPSAQIWSKAYAHRQSGPQLLSSTAPDAATRAYAHSAISIAQLQKSKRKQTVVSMKALRGRRPAAGAHNLRVAGAPHVSTRPGGASLRPAGAAAHAAAGSKLRPAGLPPKAGSGTLAAPAMPAAAARRTEPAAASPDAPPVSAAPSLRVPAGGSEKLPVAPPPKAESNLPVVLLFIAGIIAIIIYLLV